MLHYTTYEIDRLKPWVTFVHGAGGSSSIWFKQIRAFKPYFNILLVDLRGHGSSKQVILNPFKPKYTFASISNDVIEVLDHLKITKSHFIGVSLGTIIIRQIAESQPQRIASMIMSGAILKINFTSQVLMKLGNAFKSIVPYIWLYRLFAIVIMPHRNHKESRLLFIGEAKKLYRKEFIRWFRLTAEINPLLRIFRQVDVRIPTLYLMGEEDYMFLPAVEHVVRAHEFTKLVVVPRCGHVVNVEQPTVFNDTALSFLNAHATS